MMDVSIVYALGAIQKEISLWLSQGAPVKDAVSASGMLIEFNLCLKELKVGIWGEEVSLDTPLKSGDRIEIYRPLRVDPKLLRKQRAKTQCTHF